MAQAISDRLAYLTNMASSIAASKLAVRDTTTDARLDGSFLHNPDAVIQHGADARAEVRTVLSTCKCNPLQRSHGSSCSSLSLFLLLCRPRRLFPGHLSGTLRMFSCGRKAGAEASRLAGLQIRFANPGLGRAACNAAIASVLLRGLTLL